MQWAIVAPRTMVDAIRFENHSSIEGGHFKLLKTYEKIRPNYYWSTMLADIKTFIENCAECNRAGAPPNRHMAAPSPGNISPEYPLNIIGLDFAIKLPKSDRGNSVLIVFIDFFTAYLMVKPAPDRSADTTAKTFEEKSFNKMLGQKQYPTLAYRPQSNGQTERIIQTLFRAIRIYSEDPTRKDWDDFAERLVFAVNTSISNTRHETPFYLMHGWDPQTTITSALPTTHTESARQNWRWRIRIQKQYLYAQGLARDVIAEAQLLRAEDHNAQLPENRGNRIAVGDDVWLFIHQVDAGVKKKLAHLWHGPFRVQRKISDYASEIQRVSRRGGRNYCFQVEVHDSRQKLRRNYEQRPTEMLEDVVAIRFDVDLALDDNAYDPLEFLEFAQMKQIQSVPLNLEIPNQIT
ncbi:hypothetical protein Ae201684P_016876 [Aphanomyces euteiches]|nr:hypothetical protein Ae201684P_016876 [Aphanomyces euteiches]